MNTPVFGCFGFPAAGQQNTSTHVYLRILHPKQMYDSILVANNTRSPLWRKYSQFLTAFWWWVVELFRFCTFRGQGTAKCPLTVHSPLFSSWTKAQRLLYPRIWNWAIRSFKLSEWDSRWIISTQLIVCTGYSCGGHVQKHEKVSMQAIV